MDVARLKNAALELSLALIIRLEENETILDVYIGRSSVVMAILKIMVDDKAFVFSLWLQMVLVSVSPVVPSPVVGTTDVLDVSGAVVATPNSPFIDD